MISSTIRMAIPAVKHNDALKIVRSIAVMSRDNPGCLSYYFYRDIEDSNVLMLQGNWKIEEDLERHIRSEEYRNLLLVLEMSLKQPEVRFDTISSSTGIENIEKIRSTIPRG
ncbi:MAG: quinol monooxygenase YgiN [Desulforhopalus sp.]|jgi:quinol monooxygenase YgiN